MTLGGGYQSFPDRSGLGKYNPIDRPVTLDEIELAKDARHALKTAKRKRLLLRLEESRDFAAQCSIKGQLDDLWRDD